MIIELTVCFETSFEAAAERKETKYHDLVISTERAGYNTTLITLEMGSRGTPHLPGFTQLAHELFMLRKELSKLLHQTSQAAQPSSHHWFVPERERERGVPHSGAFGIFSVGVVCLIGC